MTKKANKTGKKQAKNKTHKKTKPAAGATEEQKLKDLAEKYCQPLSEEAQAELEAFLQKDLKLVDSEVEPEDLWDAVAKSDNRLVIDDATTAYLPALRSAMALCEFLKSSEERFAKYVPILAERVGVKTTESFNLLIAVVRSVIKYGEEDRRVWSRDAQAVSWLQRQDNVTSQTLFDWQEDNQGGVDSWAKAEQEQRKKEKAAEAGEPVKPKPTTAAQRVTELRKELEDGDGAVLLVKKKGNQLVSLKFQRIKKVDQKKLWPKIKQALAKPSEA